MFRVHEKANIHKDTLGQQWANAQLQSTSANYFNRLFVQNVPLVVAVAIVVVMLVIDYTTTKTRAHQAFVCITKANHTSPSNERCVGGCVHKCMFVRTCMNMDVKTFAIVLLSLAYTQ